MSRPPLRAPRTRSTLASREKNQAGDPFYWSLGWRRLRAVKLARQPLCEQCRKAGQVTPANVVHHKIDRAVDPSRELDIDNLESLCVSCHNAETSRRRGG